MYKGFREPVKKSRIFRFYKEWLVYGNRHVSPPSTIGSFSFYVCGFHVILRINNAYLLKQRQLFNLCNAEVMCFSVVRNEFLNII
jgi:hypothetical protein